MVWLTFANPFFLIFLGLPPILIFLRLRRGVRFRLGRALLAYVVLGWATLNAGIWLNYELLAWLVETTVDPPDAWTRAMTTDGAKKAFGFLIGWLYAFLYFLLWYVPVWGVARFAGFCGTKSSETAPHSRGLRRLCGLDPW
jgi:hypothetical protein